MKVEFKSRTDEELEEMDYRDKLEIFVDDEPEFYVHDGEPEDANLSRDFADCWNIHKLMQLAYDAGKRNEPIEFI